MAENDFKEKLATVSAINIYCQESGLVFALGLDYGETSGVVQLSESKETPMSAIIKSIMAILGVFDLQNIGGRSMRVYLDDNDNIVKLQHINKKPNLRVGE